MSEKRATFEWLCALVLIPAAYGTWRFLGHQGDDLGHPLEWLAVALLPICLGKLLRRFSRQAPH